MNRQCAWCKGSVAKTLSPDRRRIADSVCGNCSESFVFQMGVPLQTFIDSLQAPIFVVDGDVVVQAANKWGYAMLKKDATQVLKQLGGVVFECAYARLPGGCGRTVHCSGCAIRRSVYHTMETGKSLTRVAAILNCGEAPEPGKIAMHISTEKMGNIVLLRVDAPEEQRKH